MWRASRIAFNRRAAALERPELVKSLILKAPQLGGEKGVLSIAFEVEWLRLIEHHDAARLLRDYELVVASSWSPLDYASVLSLANLSADPVFVQVSNPRDLDPYGVCEPIARTIPIMACDWIDPTFYRPRPHAEREIDILMVAGWSALKRHRLLFQALRRMSPRLRVVLVGQDADRTADDIWAEAKELGVSNRIEMVHRAVPAAVSELQCNARASVVLTRQEGSSLVTTESFFADAPVLMLRDARIGARAYINRSTGLLTDAQQLDRDLSRLVERSGSYAPREWALAHVTARQTTFRLNAILRAHAGERHRPWTRDIVPMCRRPDPAYVRERDLEDLEPAYEDLRERLGITFRDYPAGLVAR